MPYRILRQQRNVLSRTKFCLFRDPRRIGKFLISKNLLKGETILLNVLKFVVVEKFDKNVFF